jgi:hypothetical protein
MACGLEMEKRGGGGLLRHAQKVKCAEMFSTVYIPRLFPLLGHCLACAADVTMRIPARVFIGRRWTLYAL